MRLSVTLGTALLAAVLGHPSSAGAALPRATTDRPDDQAGAQVHFVYVVPRDATDRELDTNGAIASSVASFQAWLLRETGGRALRVDTFRGELDVTFFRLATDDAVVAARGAYVREQIEEELFAAGFGSPTRVYGVYYDGGSTWACGGGDPQPEFRGAFGAMYLRGTPPGASCASNALGVTSPGYFEFGMLHEIVHTLGFVTTCAPHARGDYPAGHVSDSPFDLMWSGDAPWGVNFPDQMRFDVGHDDYYGHGRADCPDLANSPYLAPVQMIELGVAVAGRGKGLVETRTSSSSEVATCPPTCSASFARGTAVTLTAVASKGSAFAGWAGTCASAGPFGNTCAITLDDPSRVTARFDRKQYAFTLSVRGPGRVVCTPRCAKSVEHGRGLVLRAVPRPGARFVGWLGACRGKGLCRITATRPIGVTARFR
jgi:hypothetical protein